MKKLLNLVLVSLLLIGVSCGSQQRNQVKLSIAAKAGEAGKKFYFKETNVATVCETSLAESQSEEFGADVTKLAQKFLGADTSTGNKSILGDALIASCKYSLKEGIPALAKVKFDSYSCLIKKFGQDLGGVADKVCDGIKL